MKKNEPTPLKRGHFCQLLVTIPEFKGCDTGCDLDTGVTINLEVATLPIIKKVLDIYEQNHHHVLIEQRGIVFIKERIAKESVNTKNDTQ